ncbi:hypothetical protein HGRIS_002639 [Hohenbuehelia grisea]|uniref:Uncharacterized protein n=1 Tax=Hohenbuehelia grisea TaxID=104357 RepID=A0ABR3JL19_9AGAR
MASIHIDLPSVPSDATSIVDTVDKPKFPHSFTRTIDSDGITVMQQVRRVTSSSTPLAVLLSDPELMRRLSHRKKKKKRDGSNSRASSRSSSLYQHIITEEERQVHHLRSILSTLGDHLEYETKRANSAVERADYAETRAKEFCTRFLAMENARLSVESELSTSRAETDRCRLQMHDVDQQLKRAKLQIESLERQRNDLEESLHRSRDVTRDSEKVVVDYETKLAERDQRHRADLQRWYDTGYKHGHPEGYWDGFKRGHKRGFSEGEHEGARRGRERGRNDERRTALGAFDAFLAGQIQGFDERLHDVVRRWRASVYPLSRKGSDVLPVASDRELRQSDTSTESDSET